MTNQGEVFYSLDEANRLIGEIDRLKENRPTGWEDEVERLEQTLHELRQTRPKSISTHEET